MVLRPIPPAFSLVELLVVITIIVILLALLTPALDQAIYQAELTSCAARTRSIAQGVTFYAGDARRFYPYRPTVDLYPGMTAMGWLNNGWDNLTSERADDRPVFRSHIPVNASLNCPLNGWTDIEGSRREPTITFTYSQYSLWFGFYFRERPGMRKLGDRLMAPVWGGPDESFALLASDFSMVHRTNSFGYSGHPDRQGLWPGALYQDQPNPWDGTYDVTLAWYYGEAARGELDLNFAYTDSSVRRLENVPFGGLGDERIDYIAELSQASLDSNRTVQVPSER